MSGVPLPLEEAQARLLALAAPLPIEQIAGEKAVGRFLAEPLVARRTQPAADVSAMDGYALRLAEGADGWRVVGESAAGHPFTGKIGVGEAVRIATGALVPEGADCVVVQEDCAREGERLRFAGTAPSPSERHIRSQGFDFREGAVLLDAGTQIGPAALALAITAGHGQVAVRRQPRLAIIDSGDELVRAGIATPRHCIPASNGAMLAALASALPCTVQRIGPVADALAALVGAFDGACDADVVVTSGGASVGDHDLVRPALQQIGADLAFWRVAIRPGKPLLVATRARTHAAPQIILGLPGNPGSSLVTGTLFLLPLVRRLLGAAHCLPRAVTAELAGPLPAGAARREFRRAMWDGKCVRDGALHDSGALASLALANSLIDRPAGAPAAVAGEAVRIYPLENGGIA